MNPIHSNKIAEMFAIYKVLVYIKENYQLKAGYFAIMSDSLTSINLIKNRNPKASRVLVFEIHRLLYELKTNKTIKIQWIPAHRGILGNEAADTAAKAALSVNNSTITRMSYEDRIKIMHIRLIDSWQSKWERDIIHQNKGRDLFQVKSKIGVA